MRWWPKWLRALDSAVMRVTGELEQTRRQVADNFEFQNRTMAAMQDRIRALELWRQSGCDDGR